MTVKTFVKQAIRLPLEGLAARFGEHTQKAKEPRLWILMYHRVLPQTDPRFEQEEPGMIVTPETLSMHLDTLKRHFELVSLTDWIERKQQGRPLPLKACALTFDDGWLDNYQYALPVLEQHQAPATLFVVSHMMGTCEEFWPNRIAKLLLLPQDQLQSIDWLQDLVGRAGFSRETQAQTIYQLKSMPDNKIIELLNQTETRLNLTPTPTHSLMNWDQVQKMHQTGLVDIGSHTKYHVRLRADVEPRVMGEEIIQSKDFIETKLGIDVKLFCYPNGDWCPSARSIVQQHYLSAVTTQKGINVGSTKDFFTLPRMGVHEDCSLTKTKLLARLSNWPRT